MLHFEWPEKFAAPLDWRDTHGLVLDVNLPDLNGLDLQKRVAVELPTLSSQSTPIDWRGSRKRKEMD
jgi:hypothetical protein